MQEQTIIDWLGILGGALGTGAASYAFGGRILRIFQRFAYLGLMREIEKVKQIAESAKEDGEIARRNRRAIVYIAGQLGISNSDLPE